MMSLVELISKITIEGYEITFSGDFDGMIRVTYYEEHSPSTDGGYIRHEHLGYPDCSAKKLEGFLFDSLEQFYNEVKNGGSPKKDALAD